MELLIGFVLLALVCLVAVVIFVSKEYDRSDARLKAEAPSAFAATFDGRETAIFEVNQSVGPQTAEVVQAGIDAGYRLVHAPDFNRGVQALVFERDDQSSSRTT